MKKIILSAAVAAMALSTSAFAADKGIDIVTTGQAVIYYETNTDQTANSDIFSREASEANVGVQLNLDADLGNNFTFGSQLSYLGTLGLENTLVSGTKQNVGQATANDSLTDEIALTKIFVAKKVGNTTVKVGRQELPKSLSPFAFSEGWNVFKNTFEAGLVVNTDIKDTTIVGAYVGGANGSVGDIADFTSFEAYMLTAQNKSIPMTTLTGSYYNLPDDGTIMWIDAQVAGKDMPLGLKVGLQGGQVDDGTDSGTAYGAKISLAPVKALTLQAAYSSVDDKQAMKNATGIKTPLFTQMIYNQNAIAKDNDTIVVKAVYNTGDYGKIIAQYGMTSSGADSLLADNDYDELDLIYKVKSGGVTYWASAMMINTDTAGGIIGGSEDSDLKVRLWARLAF